MIRELQSRRTDDGMFLIIKKLKMSLICELKEVLVQSSSVVLEARTEPSVELHDQ